MRYIWLEITLEAPAGPGQARMRVILMGIKDDPVAKCDAVGLPEGSGTAPQRGRCCPEGGAGSR